MGPGGHLRQVRHAEHLAALAEAAQLAADDLGHAAADAAVHLVEDEAGNGARLRGHHLEGEGDTGELAAGGDPRQGAHRLARIGRDQEGHGVAAMARGARCGLDRDLEAPARHAELAHGLAHRPGEPCRRGPACLAEPTGGLPPGRLRRGGLGAEGLGALAGRLELGELGAQPLQDRRELDERPHPVLAGQVVERPQPALGLRQGRRVHLEAGGVVAQGGCGLVHPDQGLVHQRARRPQVRIQRRQRLELGGGAGEQSVRARGLALVQALQGRLRALEQAAGVGQPAVLGLEGLDGLAVEPHRLQLADLVAQELETLLPRRIPAREGLERAQRLLPALPGAGDRAGHGCPPAAPPGPGGAAWWPAGH